MMAMQEQYPHDHCRNSELVLATESLSQWVEHKRRLVHVSRGGQNLWLMSSLTWGSGCRMLMILCGKPLKGPWTFGNHSNYTKFKLIIQSSAETINMTSLLSNEPPHLKKNEPPSPVLVRSSLWLQACCHSRTAKWCSLRICIDPAPPFIVYVTSAFLGHWKWWTSSNCNHIVFFLCVWVCSLLFVTRNQ